MIVMLPVSSRSALGGWLLCWCFVAALGLSGVVAVFVSSAFRIYRRPFQGCGNRAVFGVTLVW